MVTTVRIIDLKSASNKIFLIKIELSNSNTDAVMGYTPL